LLTAFGLTPGGSSTVQIYKYTIHKITQLIWEECGPCPVFANYTVAFALQLRKRHGKTFKKRNRSCYFWCSNRSVVVGYYTVLL